MSAKDDATNAAFRQLKLMKDKAGQLRPTAFFFYGEPEFIAALGEVLVKRGFEIGPTTAEHPGLIATMALAMDGPVFTRTANWLASLAGDLGVAFDGWETEIVPETH